MASGLAQTRALAHVRTRAEGVRSRARETMTRILARSTEPEAAIDAVLARLRMHAMVTLNFHPDRLLASGRTVAEGLLHEGRYRSQFVTGVTNGSRTAFAGGARDGWEHQLFGGAYQKEGVAFHERPTYGALNLMQHADGGSPRFGSCHFALRAHMTARCTLTWGDSHEGPEHVGTIDTFDDVLAVLLENVDTKQEALGVAGLTVASLLRTLSALERRAANEAPRGAQGRALDAYIEAQVHGEIDLAADVDALVIDPSFDGTLTGAALTELCTRYGIALHRHRGFVLATKDVPDDFRGPRMVPLAERVDRSFAAVHGQLDAATIGRAAQSLQREPETWSDWGTFEESLQHLKQLWHVLVQFGQCGSATQRAFSHSAL